MRRSNRAVALIASVALVGALAGCGTNLQGGAAESSGGKTTLTYWGKWAKGTPQATLFESIIKDYEKKSGNKVEVQWLGNGEEDQVKNSIATGAGPDFYDSAIDHTAEFRAAGALADMSDVFGTKIPGEDKTIEQVLPASVMKVIADSKGPGFVPHSVFSVGLWYDASAQPGFTDHPPKTFAAFLTAAKEIQSKTGKQPIALDGTINSYNAFWTYQLLLSTAGPGALSKLATDPAAWQSPEVRTGLEAVQSLVDAKLFQADYMATKFPDAQNAWAAGEQSFNLNGTWLSSETASVRASAVKPRIMVLPPVAATKNQVVEVGATGWAMSANSKHKKQVAEFLAFAMQKTYNDRIATDAGNIPSRADSPAPEELRTIQKQIDETTTPGLDFDGVATTHPKWWNDVFLPLDDKLISGSISVDEFLAEGAKQTKEQAGK